MNSEKSQSYKTLLSLTVLLLMLFSFNINSQTASQDFDQSKRVSYRKADPTVPKTRDETLAGEVVIPIQIHIITDSFGNHRDTSGIIQNFQNIQPWFSQAGFIFKLCHSIHFINSDDWYELDSDQESEDMIYSANNPNTVDVFYVKNINHIAACGYATLGWDTDGFIVIQDGCNEATLAHEIGHYFNLSHTHDNTIPELVNGSNCGVAGDHFCDTPADPDLSGKVNGACVYTGSDVDANGDSYTPNTNNIMSYTLKTCNSSFSTEQSAAMLYYYDNTAKDNLICGSSVNFSVKNIVSISDTISRDVPYSYTFDLSNMSAFSYSGELQYAITYSESLTGSRLPVTTDSIQGSWEKYSSSSQQISFSAPSGLADGHYYFFLELNPSKKVTEQSYTDNETQLWNVYVSGNVALTVDLEAHASLINEPYAGFPVSLNFDITNVGQLDYSDDFPIVDFYISSDSIPSLDDLISAKSISYADLSVGVKNSGIWSCPLLKDHPLQYIIMVIRKNKDNNEINLDNNRFVIPVTVNQGDPGSPNADLYLVEVTFYRPTIQVYNSIKAKWKLMNTTVVDEDIYTQVRHIPIGYYVSTDAIISPDDTYLGHEMTQSGPVAQNGRYNSGSISIKMLPIAPGDYYLIAKIDDLDMLDEVNEVNNIAITNITVEAGTDADLIISNMSTPDIQVNKGDEVTVNLTVKNVGYNTAANFSVNTYISELGVFSTSDPLFSTTATDSLAVGDSVSLVHKANIPSDLDPGDYFHTAVISGSGNEFNGNNSIFPTVPFEVTSTNVGMREDTSPWIKVYPNPTTGHLWITSERAAEIVVTIRSALGQELDVQLVKGKASIDLPRASGIYYISLKSEGKEKITRVIKY